MNFESVVCLKTKVTPLLPGKTATSYLRTVLTTNLALSKIKEKYKGALIDLETRQHTEGKERFEIVRVDK